MPFSSDLMQSPYFRAALDTFLKPGRHVRPGGRARILHLGMERALNRGPTSEEVNAFGQHFSRKLAEQQQEREAAE